MGINTGGAFTRVDANNFCNDVFSIEDNSTSRIVDSCDGGVGIDRSISDGSTAGFGFIKVLPTSKIWVFDNISDVGESFEG
ncbi:hypothetical protein AGMMS49921_02600 [Endomicrobiia bacterium]|nr:hypothetical protein AGMMS49921_02600 [Endomicrobiia bacterium]